MHYETYKTLRLSRDESQRYVRSSESTYRDSVNATGLIRAILCKEVVDIIGELPTEFRSARERTEYGNEITTVVWTVQSLGYVMPTSPSTP